MNVRGGADMREEQIYIKKRFKQNKLHWVGGCRPFLYPSWKGCKNITMRDTLFGLV